MSEFESLCSNCMKQGCCTDSAVPLVFAFDYENIKKVLKPNSEFFQDVIINGNHIKAIAKKKNSKQCVFWDEKKFCTIYENRPFDCKAYPFDILKINGKYHWIVYTCNPESNWKWTEEYLTNLENDPGYKEIKDNLIEFEEHTQMILPLENSKTPYSILREIK